MHVSRPGCEPIRFLVNARGGRDITFTDPRPRRGNRRHDRHLGHAAGAACLQAAPADAGRLSRELARFVGAERAEEVIGLVRSEFFLT